MTIWDFLFYEKLPYGLQLRNAQSSKTLLCKGFDLLRKPKDYRTYVRRRLWFACLWAFIDLCQSVKKLVF